MEFNAFLHLPGKITFPPALWMHRQRTVDPVRMREIERAKRVSASQNYFGKITDLFEPNGNQELSENKKTSGSKKEF